MKVLILKTGHSETLDPEISRHASLGDVLRSTVILHPFAEEHITWVTDRSAYPLLHGIPCVKRLLAWDFETALQLMAEKYDIMVNLEKSPSACALASRVDAWQKYGFRFDDILGEARPYKDSIGAFSTYIESDAKARADRPWQHVLYEMIGMEWREETYWLGLKPETTPIGDRVGLNHKVGSKFPGKAWSHFSKLYRAGLNVSWQEGENLQDYVNWLNTCEVIVTNDSLGLHLCLAMGKKFVALFGPTSAAEVWTYGLGVKVVAEDGHMDSIDPRTVEKEVRKLLAA